MQIYPEPENICRVRTIKTFSKKILLNFLCGIVRKIFFPAPFALYEILASRQQ
jgi:hypothetical protein